MLLPSPLTDEQRLCIFHDSAVGPATALEMSDSELNYRVFIESNCKFTNIAAGKLRVSDLNARGFSTVLNFKLLGMDAVDLIPTNWTKELVRHFGAKEVRDTMIETATDVVALAGTESARLLDMQLDFSLSLCAGEPEAAGTLLSLHREMPSALGTTTLKRVLDTGLRAHALKSSNVTLNAIIQHFRPSALDLQRLGYSTR